MKERKMERTKKNECKRRKRRDAKWIWLGFWWMWVWFCMCGFAFETEFQVSNFNAAWIFKGSFTLKGWDMISLIMSIWANNAHCQCSTCRWNVNKNVSFTFHAYAIYLTSILYQHLSIDWANILSYAHVSNETLSHNNRTSTRTLPFNSPDGFTRNLAYNCYMLSEYYCNVPCH